MKFGEKIRLLRNKKNISQTELGKMCDLSLRTIRNYEVDGRYPKNREVYSKLAAALGCEVNYLLSESEENKASEEFMLLAEQACASKGARQAEDLVADISAFFANGELSDHDKDDVMRALQDAYWTAKERNKRTCTEETSEE